MRSKLFKTTVFGVLLIALLLGTAACGSKNAPPAAGQTQEGGENAATVEDEVKKPDTIKWFANIGLKEEYGFEQWNEEFTELTGIKLEHPHIIGNEYYQKLELSFTSNTAPDVFISGISDGKLPLYVSQGAVIDLTDMVEKSEVLNIPSELLDSIRVNGKIYGVPFETNSGTVTYIRKDWLDKVNKEVPTTYEEFIDVLRAFKTVQPDAIPMTAPGLVGDQAEIYLREFYQDASPEFVLKEGKWVDGMLQDNMKDALTRLRDAYEEGLLDMEVVTNKTSTCREKWYAGKVGVFNYWAGDWNINMEDRVKDNIPEAQVIPIPAIQETDYLKRVPTVMAISALSKNPEGVFKYFIEYANDKGEGSILFQHGVENLHWKQDGENIVHLAPEASPNEILAKAFISPVVAITQITAPNTNYAVDERINNSLAILEADGRQLVGMPLSKTLSKVNADMLALKDKTVSSIVLGIKGVDEGLAEYKAEVTKLGIDAIIQELNEAAGN